MIPAADQLLLPLAYGTNFGKAVPHWKQRLVSWKDFCRLLGRPASAKDQAMSYVMGTLAPGPGNKCKCTEFLHRTKNTLVNRSAITLDADYCGNAGSALIGALRRTGLVAAAHTTWSSTEDDERYRIIIPLSRLVEPLEYQPLARQVMRTLGSDFFDHTCEQASRLMYMPAAPNGGDQYWYANLGYDVLDVEFWLDLAGGADVEQVREPVEVRAGADMSNDDMRALAGLARKMASCEEGNRDSLLLWCLKMVLDLGLDPDAAAEVLVAAAVHSGLEEDVCWEKVGRVLG